MAGRQECGAVQIAILADTHLPKGARRLPAACLRVLRESALIIHAGDFTHHSVLEEIRTYGEVAAVHGNVDDTGLRAELPGRRTIEAGGRRIGLVHDAGPARGRPERLWAWFPQADAVIFGHSHLPLHKRNSNGFQIFNPGSPTERRRSPHHTMGIARVHGRGLTFELLQLD